MNKAGVSEQGTGSSSVISTPLLWREISAGFLDKLEMIVGEIILRIRDTLSKTKKEFPSVERINSRTDGSHYVTMYSCGPTVYDYASIGNFSAYLMADLVKRYLLVSGYKVKHVMNITDVGHLTADADVDGEDKLEAAAKKEGIDPYKIADKYTKQFIADAIALGIMTREEAEGKSPDFVLPKATDHIAEMIAIIKDLLEKKFAYIAHSGVYFDTTKFEQYGKLSGNSLDQLKSGARVEVHPDKHHPADFALWKLNQPSHLMQWDSPWGKGYPGWHIECSAMSMKYLGAQIDIHTGGEDNIFPHHESEIAQSECATGIHPFVHFWLHRQFLTVDGQKMSKSLGNTYRLQDILDRGFEAADFRMLILSSHYRTGVNFSWEALKAARERRLNWKIAAQNALDNPDIEKGINFITEKMNDDLNTPETFAYIDSLVREKKSPAQLWHYIDKLFGLELEKSDVIPEAIEQMAVELDNAREAKDFAKADSLRAEIIKLGYEVLTTDQGTIVRKR